ncbi:hypothetical protein IAQ61_000372 [Plenodomus lingam]|uniref:uncharacterized protein n=1 Tax=Leptosphaeria maculans TaxID=5022 RepID=UPI003327C0A4|nr:hypothetical protein IAQ61_000372 [Plenodomus lingam]
MDGLRTFTHVCGVDEGCAEESGWLVSQDGGKQFEVAIFSPTVCVVVGAWTNPKLVRHDSLCIDSKKLLDIWTHKLRLNSKIATETSSCRLSEHPHPIICQNIGRNASIIRAHGYITNTIYLIYLGSTFAMASQDKKTVKTQTNRLPAPALFVGPPSHNASNTSLLPPGDSRDPTRIPLVRQRSLLSPDSKRPLPPTTGNQYDGDNLSLTTSNPSAPFQRRQRAQSQAAEAEASSRAEAVWAEMQNTLEEVELSAIKGPGMTVFGSDHSRALDELRKAQIELAKAWARSEAEEHEEPGDQQKKSQDIKATDLASQTLVNASDNTTTTKGDKLFDRIKLEEETEKDIELSRRRREENDRYFEKVNKGVQEVVVRLEEVAKAMRGVESESQEIWGHGSDGGADTESLTTVPSST